MRQRASAALLAHSACSAANSGANFKCTLGTNGVLGHSQLRQSCIGEGCIVAREAFVHTRHASAHITQTLASVALLCSSSQVHGQVAAAAPTQTFVIHGTPKTCSAITQLDSALSTDSQQFFAGWTEKDYADAVAWSQACAQYGWHVPGRPRIPLLEAQHNKVRGSAQMQIVSGAATAGATPSPSVQAVTATPAKAEPSAATGGALASPQRWDHTASNAVGDGLLTDDDFYKKHFHQESVWVAKKANLDIGEDRGPSSWPSARTSAQRTNRLTADKIVLYCARKSNSGESGTRPLLWDWRRCEFDEASAYNRLVSGNEFPSAGRGIVLGCAGVDSYIYLERCSGTMIEVGKP
jgi:hypothetical protein